MDLYCQKCNEPWDVYTVEHELDPGGRPQIVAKDDFMDGVGCPACDWGNDPERATKAGTFKSMAMAAMQDLMEDDPDGMAAMLDDWNYMFGLE